MGEYFRPETSLYVKKVEEEKKKKLKGEGEDNRSFFAKYVSICIYVYMCIYMYISIYV